MLIQAHIRPTAPVFSHAFKRQTRAVAMLSSAKITSTVTHLKTRYYKYLENLCAANGIELAALKNESQEHERLEMFFTGLPVLVGLKYFTHLRCLRLVGQDITNLRPLGDVADSLEELWVCEGVLSDISGIEQCHRLQRIYAFDNIISSGAPLEALTDLKELWIQDNCLTDLSFLHSLSNLNVLKIGGKQLSDMTIRTVLEWPGKLQTLNAASDSRKSLQSLIPLEECSMLRKVNLGGDSEGYFMWIGCHFPFLEYLDDDKLEDKFVPFYLIFTVSSKGLSRRTSSFQPPFDAPVGGSSVDRHAMPNVSSVFPLILCFALAMTAAPDSANESCSLENLRTQLHFHSALIFIVTADCRLHVFRSWDAGTPLDVVKPETKLGNSPCGPDSKVIHFVYRRHQMPPILVVIVKFSTQEYSLLEIDLEHELNDQENATVPLKDRIGVNTTKQIHSPKPLSSCIFVDHQLICFWVDRDRKRVFQQKFHFDEKDLIYKGEDTPIAFDRTRRRSLDKNIVVSVWDQPSSPSVFLYDPHIAGWLYRISDQAFLARGQKRKYLHRIHSAEGELKSLTSMDKTVLLSTECYANEGCMYFMNFLQIKALAPHACVFHSRNPVIVGILTDVRHPLVPRSHERSHEKYTDLQQETQQFEALIVLASVVFASLAGFLGSAVVHESLKNEQKMEMENRMNALGRRFFKKPDEDVPAGNV